MDFLDPKKQRNHRIQLAVGYVLIAFGILIATVILLYQAYGFGLGHRGEIIQNGLVYVASTPHPAQVYLNGVLRSSQTNTRFVLQSGQYTMQLRKNGYRPWQRAITVDGGKVEYFTYPFLFPNSLITTNLQGYLTSPDVASQSLDRRWLIINQPNAVTNFDLFDLNNPTVLPIVLSLSGNLISTATTNQKWQVIDWASDNRHILMEHFYDTKAEFILIDRQDPTQSINLNRLLSTSPTSISFQNQQYDHYYIYNSVDNSLQTASIQSPELTPLLSQVTSYATLGQSVLYTTTKNAPTGKVLVMLSQSNQTYNLRSVPINDNYLLNMARYSNTLYVTIGVNSDSKLYIYKDPISQLTTQTPLLVPLQILKVKNPTYVSFSPSSQFIVDESANQFAVYDIENDKSYIYALPEQMDAPQLHANWMDGSRLNYVTNQKLVVFDYDSANKQILVPASPGYLPFFDSNYQFLYTLAPQPKAAASTQIVLTSTSLQAP